MNRISPFVAALVGLVACGTRAPAPPPAGILRTATIQDVPTLDPGTGYDTISWFFEQMLFNTLVDYDDASNLVPELALGWESSPDGKEYTFALKPGVRFSNGRRLVAADVKYSIERVLRPSLRSQGAEFFSGIEGAAEFAGGTAAGVRGIEVVDDATVRFRLSSFDPLFLHKMALQFAAIVPREVAESLGEDFGHQPIGSGPFVLTAWRRGQYLKLRRNDEYFRPGLPKIDGVYHLVGLNEQLMWMKYESGELDVSAIPPSEFPRVLRDPSYRDRLVSETSLATSYIGINCEIPPFDDVRVRRAISLAINRDKALRLISNAGRLAQGILPPGMPGYEAIPEASRFDPAAARQLLRSAGAGDGIDTVLWTRTDETALRLAQSFQQDLADVGVHVRIKNLSWAAYLNAIRTPKRVPLFALAWQADFPDPSNFLEVLFHSRNRDSNNHTFFADREADELVDAAAATSDPAARLALLQRAHHRIVEQSAWAVLYHPITYEVVHPRVRNYRRHALRPPRLEEVYLDEVLPELETGEGARASLPHEALPKTACCGR